MRSDGSVRRAVGQSPCGNMDTRARRHRVWPTRAWHYPDFMMREEMDRVRGERAPAEQSSREREKQLARLDMALGLRGRVHDLARRFTGGLERMDFDERRGLLRLLVDDVIYDAGLLTTVLSPRSTATRTSPRSDGESAASRPTG